VLFMPPPSSPAKKPAAPPREFSLLAGFLSYLVPGLGQIYQGRIAKGVVFLVSIYALFFYGMYLGHWSNVYLPKMQDNTGLFESIYARPQYLGQFWVGVAAWPALWQRVVYDPRAETGSLVFRNFQRAPEETVLNALQNKGDKHWDLGWVYTVIAGVLNIMVIYDAYAGPAFSVSAEESRESQAKNAAASTARP
jgi:hypothetical protein